MLNMTIRFDLYLILLLGFALASCQTTSGLITKTDAYNKTDTYICSFQANGLWMGSNATIFKAEAKRRGLNCGLDKESTTQTASSSSQIRPTYMKSSSNLYTNRTDTAVCDDFITSNLAKIEAKKRKLDCFSLTSSTQSTSKTSRPTKTITTNIDNISDKQLCRQATFKGGWSSLPRNVKYVREAHRRGLACGTGETSTTQTASLSSPTTTTTKISDRALCVSATTRTGLTGELEWDNRFSHHKDEAKRRGLTCGVVGSPETMQTQKTVEDCAEWGCYKDWEVCRKASFVKSFLPFAVEWGQQSDAVAEAKKRGLKCGVGGSEMDWAVSKASDKLLCKKGAFTHELASASIEAEQQAVLLSRLSGADSLVLKMGIIQPKLPLQPIHHLIPIHPQPQLPPLN